VSNFQMILLEFKYIGIFSYTLSSSSEAFQIYLTFLLRNVPLGACSCQKGVKEKNRIMTGARNLTFFDIHRNNGFDVIASIMLDANGICLSPKCWCDSFHRPGTQAAATLNIAPLRSPPNTYPRA